MSDTSDARRLFAVYAAGRIDEDGLRELESAIRGDAVLRADFIEYLNVDSALSDLAALSNAEFEAIQAPGITAVPNRTPENHREGNFFGSSGLAITAALAAALLLMIGFAVLKLTGDTDDVSLPVIATILSQDGARFEGADQSVRVGERVELGQLRLLEGRVQMRLSSGVTLELFGPLDGAFEDSMRLQLANGRMNADVGESGKGFSVVTRFGEIIDLGTRFGVDVGEVDAKVAVFDGEVQVTSEVDSDEPSTVNIVEGEGIQLRIGKRPRRLSAVWMSLDAQRLSGSDAKAIVANVSDNSQSKSMRRFYGIIAGGMQEGTIAYTTIASTPRRNVVWQATEGEEFPVELLGADVVCPFHIDRREQSLAITLQLSESATVYVMHDERRQPPEWLKADFRQTGMKLRSGPWRQVSPVTIGIEPDSEGEFFVRYSVWEKRTESPGSIELGAPQVSGEQGSGAMYGIAVQRLSKQ